jgi:hypothetical protein
MKQESKDTEFVITTVLKVSCTFLVRCRFLRLYALRSAKTTEGWTKKILQVFKVKKVTYM